MSTMSMREFSVDAAADLALELVRSSCSSAEIEATAKAVGAGILFMRRKKRAYIWEELFCASAGLAAHSITESRSSRVAMKITQTVFEVKALRLVRSLLGAENEAANPRFHEKIKSYKSALQAGQDAIGLTTLFHENLSRNIGGLNINRQLQLIPIIASMQMAMRDAMSGLKIVLDGDSE